jgi:hypothetical protein
LGGLNCWAANEDKVAGDGTALAVSIDGWTVRDMVGIEKVRARADSEGNDEDGVVSSLVGGLGGGEKGFVVGGEEEDGLLKTPMLL